MSCASTVRAGGFLAVIALGLCALPERASACGVCTCFEHRWARFPTAPAPLNLRILIDAAPEGALGTPLDLSSLRLRRRDDGGVVSFVLQPFGMGTDLYWLIPSSLDPATYYDLDVVGTTALLETFVTGSASDLTAPSLGAITVEHPASDDSCASRAGVTFALAIDPGPSAVSPDAGVDSGIAFDAGAALVDAAAVQVDVDLPGGLNRSVVLLPIPGLSKQRLALGSALDATQPISACLGPAELHDGVVGVMYPAHLTAFDFAGNPSAEQDVVFELETVQAASCPGDGGLGEPDSGSFYDDYDSGLPPYGYNYGDDAVRYGSTGSCLCSLGRTQRTGAGGAFLMAVVTGLFVRTRRRLQRRLAARSERFPS